MKKIWILSSIVAGLASLSLAQVPEVPAEPEAGRELMLASDGTVSSEVLEQIAGFAQANLSVVVEVMEVDPTSGSLKDQLSACVFALPASRGAAVVLLAPKTPEDTQTLFLHDEGLAGVNVPRVTEGAEESTAQRRLERLVMRGYAFLLGLGETPDPFSVMTPYAQPEDLDRMGRNHSPPDIRTFQMKAREAGYRFDDKGPLYTTP